MNRSKVPRNTSEELLFINRHTCCICREKRKHVQIHHIDSDNRNNEISNLAILCLDCHSRVSGDEGLGQRYSVNEVVKYKLSWQQICSNVNQSSDDDGDTEEDEDGDDGDTETVTLERNSQQMYEYSLDKGQTIAGLISSEKDISVHIIESLELDRLEEDEDADIEILYSKENKNEIEFQFVAPEDGDYTVLIENESKKTIEVEIDIQIW